MGAIGKSEFQIEQRSRTYAEILSIEAVHNPMEAIIHLTNGMLANTEDIKCPFCGKKMKLSQYATKNPDTILDKESLLPPFSGIVVKEKTRYESVFRCMNNCCELHVKHEIETLLL